MTGLDALPLWSLTTLYAAQEGEREGEEWWGGVMDASISGLYNLYAVCEAMLVCFEIALYNRMIFFPPLCSLRTSFIKL